MLNVQIHLPNQIHNKNDSFSFDITGEETLPQLIERVFQREDIRNLVDKQYQEEVKNPHKFKALWEDIQPVNPHVNLGTYFQNNEQSKSLHINLGQNPQDTSFPSLLFICTQDAMLFRVLKSSTETGKNLIICSDPLRSIQWEKSLKRWSTLRIGRFRSSISPFDKRLIITSSDIVIMPISEFASYHSSLSSFLPSFYYLWFDLSDTRKLREFYNAFNIVKCSLKEKEESMNGDGSFIVHLAPLGWNMKFYKESMEKLETGKQLVIHKPKNESENIKYWTVQCQDTVNFGLEYVEQLINALIKQICTSQVALSQFDAHQETKPCLIRALGKLLNEIDMEECIDNCISFALEFNLTPYILALNCLKKCIHAYYVFESYPSFELLNELLSQAFEIEIYYEFNIVSSLSSQRSDRIIFEAMQMEFNRWQSQTQLFNDSTLGTSTTNSKLSTLFTAMRNVQAQRVMIVVPDISLAQSIKESMSRALYEYSSAIVYPHMLSSSHFMELYNEFMETKINCVIVSNEYFEHNLIYQFARNIHIDHIFRFDARSQCSYTLSLFSVPATQHLIINSSGVEQRTFLQEDKAKQDLHDKFGARSHTSTHLENPPKTPFRSSASSSIPSSSLSSLPPPSSSLSSLNIHSNNTLDEQPVPMEIPSVSPSSVSSSVDLNEPPSSSSSSQDDSSASHSESHNYLWGKHDPQQVLHHTWVVLFDCSPPYQDVQISSGKGSSELPHFRADLEFKHNNVAEPIRVSGHGSRKKQARRNAAHQMCLKLYAIDMLELPPQTKKKGSKQANTRKRNIDNSDVKQAKQNLNTLLGRYHLPYRVKYRQVRMEGPEHNPRHTAELSLVSNDNSNDSANALTDAPKFRATENSIGHAERVCAYKAVEYLSKKLEADQQ
eukprot:gb/GECH01002179.1/.p1 GENE.gb/GECH01002179.1/~~gb/GECH01002179.1/.p1  ORF type:complete len:893 (+),score=202.63 gb/GECH01002179.1/:1-2679(+)